MQNYNKAMDISDDEDNDYDFVAQYRILERERQSRANNPCVDCEQVPDISSTSSQTETSVDITQGPSNNVQIIQPTNSDSNTTRNLTISTSGQSNAQRGFRRSKRSRNCALEPVNVIGPVIQIGDFFDGYGEIPLREIKKEPISDDDDIMANWEKRQIEEAQLEDAIAEVNHVMNVKVFWQQTRTYCFPIRMSISSIYEHFAKLENIDPSHVRLDLNKKILSPKDTPNSIKYKIIDFIDGSIEFYRSPNDTPEGKEESQEEMVNYRIKQQNVKQPIIMEMRKTDNMLILYIKLKELLDIELNSFTLVFDGDPVKYMDTMESLDLEGDECFELFPRK